MLDLKEKIIYCVVLVIFLIVSVCFGVAQTILNSGLDIKNTNISEYAKSCVFNSPTEDTITTATMSYDIDVIYEDNYLLCGENTLNTKKVYGTTMEKVKEDEKKYQEENGLVYEIKAETATRIVYTRTVEENCPNHFKIVLEDNVINIYSIITNNKEEIYMTLRDINISHLRNELKNKIEKGTYINSKEELNRFIEDLET